MTASRGCAHPDRRHLVQPAAERCCWQGVVSFATPKERRLTASAVDWRASSTAAKHSSSSSSMDHDLSCHDCLDPLQGSLESITTEDHSCGEEDSSSDDGRVPRRRRSVEGANHMADLARMTTMRNLNANIVPPARGTRRGQSSVNAASVGIAEGNEQPADAAPGHSDKVRYGVRWHEVCVSS